MGSHVIQTTDRRRLQVLELGAADGFPIVFHHGTPGSRKAHNQKPEVLAGSRAIFYDRPGYGGSDPHPNRDVSTAAAEVSTIADALGVERFAVSGISGGGPFALACAAILGERVTRVAVIAGFAPSDAPGEMKMSRAGVTGEGSAHQESGVVTRGRRSRRRSSTSLRASASGRRGVQKLSRCPRTQLINSIRHRVGFGPVTTG
jgi:pimeloyl-ACP methyl ester carboxylesterase